MCIRDRDEDELMLITQQGKVLRMNTEDVRPIGRATQGVRLIEIDEQDQVVSLVRLTGDRDLIVDGVEEGADEDAGPVVPLEDGDG